MTEDDIISGILEREAGWRDAVQRPDKTWDPPTNHGITLDTLNRYREQIAHFDGRPHPLTEADLRELDDDMAASILERQFITAPGFTPANIPFEPLRVQLIDFGVNSGPDRAVRWLQRVLGINATGTIDVTTIACFASLMHFDTADGITRWHQINDALVAARCLMITRAVAAGHINKSDEHGLLLRAVGFALVHS